METWDTLKLEGSPPLMHLVLNRPQAHNAINTAMLADLLAACQVLDGLPGLRAVLVRGAGPSFSAGADLKEGVTHSGSTAGRVRRSAMGRKALAALTDLRAVTVAAVHGHAIGGGACLAAACDFRIAAPSARLSVREASLGLSLSWNAIPAFVSAVGPTRAKEMILFGDTYEPAQLLGYGFYQEVAADEAALVAAAERWCQRVVRQPPLPSYMTKASVNALSKALDRSIFHLDDYALGLTAGSPDAAKAKDAFFAGTQPDWEYE